MQIGLKLYETFDKYHTVRKRHINMDLLKQTIIITLLITCSYTVFSQSLKKAKSNLINDLIQFDSSYKILDNYLKEKNWIDNKENYPMYVFNILSYEENDMNPECGIFIFGIKYDEPVYCFFFKNKDDSYEIDEGNSLSTTLERTIFFFKKNEIKSKKEQLEYILSVVKYYNSKSGYILENECLPNKWTKCK